MPQDTPGDDDLDLSEGPGTPFPTSPVPPSPQPIRRTPAETYQQSFSEAEVAAPGIDRMLGFGANAVLIDNLSSQWLYVPALDTHIPPFWVGVCLPLNGSQRARLLVDTPAGITPLAVVATQLIHATWTEASLERVDGESIDPSVSGAAIGAVNQGAGGAAIDTSSWWVKIGDGSTGPVKVGTAAPAVTDKGLVVRLPNSLGYNSAVAASGVIKNAAGTLYGGVFMNNNAALRYLQIFDSATVPADTTVPLFSIPVQPQSAFPFSYLRGRPFANGIAWCTSSTFGTKTIGAADAIVDAEYE